MTASVRVGSACTREVTTAPKRETVVDAAKRMRAAHVGDVVAVEDRGGRQVPVGILTDRDIALSVVATNADYIQTLTLNDVMSDDLVTARDDEDLDTALGRMREHGVRRLPVVDAAGALVGILTLDDVLQHITPARAELVALLAREQGRERRYRT